MTEPREAGARAYEQIADELDAAAAHCRTAARHLRDGEIPRAAAHAWAAYGHAHVADGSLAEQARTHAQRSRPL
jgi:glycerol-3-phosphate dehydrogenase